MDKRIISGINVLETGNSFDLEYADDIVCTFASKILSMVGGGCPEFWVSHLSHSPLEMLPDDQASNTASAEGVLLTAFTWRRCFCYESERAYANARRFPAVFWDLQIPSWINLYRCPPADVRSKGSIGPLDTWLYPKGERTDSSVTGSQWIVVSYSTPLPCGSDSSIKGSG